MKKKTSKKSVRIEILCLIAPLDALFVKHKKSILQKDTMRNEMEVEKGAYTQK